MTDKDLKAVERIYEELEKIDKKENKIYFFVLDTKGNPSGSMEYIYKLALTLVENGYNVNMLHQEDEEFIGVGNWLGEKYANIPHYNISNGEVNVGVSDILFIPEIFATVMNQTQKLPCKRIAILQNMHFLTEFMPLSIQWGDYGIMECLTNSEQESSMLRELFPYVKTHVVPPFIDDEIFNEVDVITKDLIINIVSKDQSYINRIVKPFYWKYPSFKWVSFKELRGLAKEEFAKNLKNNCITIWIDNDSNFGYTPLEAMKCGSIVLAKLPEIVPDWALDEDGKLKNDVIWFNSVQDLPRIIAKIVRSWTTDNYPSDFKEGYKETLSKFNKSVFTEKLLTFVGNVLEDRKKELNNIVSTIKSGENKDA